MHAGLTAQRLHGSELVGGGDMAHGAYVRGNLSHGAPRKSLAMVQRASSMCGTAFW
jgi:hypothetical protein